MDMATDKYIRVSGVHKRYGGQETALVLQDINLDITQGEFISVLGPSGCGKSTLLKCIAGLERITAGTITARGRAIDGDPLAHVRALALT